MPEDEIIKPDEPLEPLPKTELLVGILAKSDEAGYCRVYLNRALSSFIDVREEDVVETRPVELEQSPVAVTLVWVREVADLRTTEIRTNTVQARFLDGPTGADGRILTRPLGTGAGLIGPQEIGEFTIFGWCKTKFGQRTCDECTQGDCTVQPTPKTEGCRRKHISDDLVCTLNKSEGCSTEVAFCR